VRPSDLLVLQLAEIGRKTGRQSPKNGKNGLKLIENDKKIIQKLIDRIKKWPTAKKPINNIQKESKLA
jgi:hypothetical protein